MLAEYMEKLKWCGCAFSRAFLQQLDPITAVLSHSEVVFNTNLYINLNISARVWTFKGDWWV